MTIPGLREIGLIVVFLAVLGSLQVFDLVQVLTGGGPYYASSVVNRLGLLNTLWSVIIVQVAGGMVFNTFLFMGYFRTVAKEIEEAARVDGAGFHQTYLYVILPLARPMLATLGL